MQNNYLRGKIIAKFHTIQNFAKAVKWSNRKAYDIVNGKQEPTAKDIDTMCTALDIEIPEELRLLFFQ